MKTSKTGPYIENMKFSNFINSNRLLDQIRIEMEENGGQLEVKELNNVIKKSEEIRKRELIQEHRDEQLTSFMILIKN